MTLRVGLTHPALTKLTFMDYLLTMLRNRLRRKHSYDTRHACMARLSLEISFLDYNGKHGVLAVGHYGGLPQVPEGQ